MKRYCVLLAVVALLLLAISSVVACPIPDYVTRVILGTSQTGYWDVFRPNGPVSFPDIDHELDLALPSWATVEDDVTYRWNWDDGSGYSYGSTASHAWSSAGSYLVTVTAYDNDTYGTGENDVDVIQQFYVKVE